MRSSAQPTRKRLRRIRPGVAPGVRPQGANAAPQRLAGSKASSPGRNALNRVPAGSPVAYFYFSAETESMDPDHRIVSLIASATEIVAALDCGPMLVGRSHECDFPDFVEQLPVCSDPRIDIHASSLEIDCQVKAAVAEALSIYRVRSDQLQTLAPTLILTQTLCDVCAVSVRDVENALCEVIASRPKIVALDAMDLSGVWEDVRRVALAVGRPDLAESRIAGWQARLAEVQSACAGRKAPRVACLEWLEPLMAAGNWVPELVRIANGENLFGTAGKHSPWMSWDELTTAEPDVLVLMPCGFSIDRTRTELGSLTSQPAWSGLRAVRNANVFLVDGNQYFNRPGPRLVESAEILAEILHPGLFSTRHEGTGWQPM